MTVYTINTHCNGVQHTIYYEWGVDHSHSDYTVSSLEELHEYVHSYYGTSRFRLSYLNEDDSARQVTDESTLYYAVKGAPGGVLLLKVTPRDNRHDHSDYERNPGYEADFEPTTRRTVKRKVSTSKLARRFAVHDVECHRCDKSPIHGMCYTYRHNSDYHLCSDCWSHGDKRDWQATPFPWSRAAPRAPLSRSDYEVSKGVLHLQKLLTELGYLRLEDTDTYQGSFQGRTESAVEAFRREHEIFGNDMGKYDKRTERCLAEVIRKR